jgi:hypothetical protein
MSYDPAATEPAATQTATDPTAAEPTSGTFQLLVEQSVGNGESIRWAPEPLLPSVWPTRDGARAAALAVCRDLQPTHPYSPRRRTILEITADEYVVIVEGMTKTFHFRVSVARLIG